MKATTGELAQQITDVIQYIECNRPSIMDALFPDAPADYRREWLARGAAMFWCRLDLSNRNRVVRLAQEHVRAARR